MTTDQEPESARDRGTREGVFGGFAVLLASSYVEAVVSLARGIVVMRAIRPVGEGLMRTVDLASKYMTHSHLGALHGMSKELPLALGAGDEERAAEIENTGSAIVLYTAAIASLLLTAYALIAPGLVLSTRQVLLLGSIIILCGQAYSLYRVVLRSWGVFKVLAVSSVINTLAMTFFLVGGSLLFLKMSGQPIGGAVGATWGWLLTNILLLWYLHKAVRFGFTPKIDWAVARRLVLAGLPLVAVLFADVLLRTVDGMLILKVWKVARFGVYTVATQASTYLYRLPETAGFVLMPRIWERYGATNQVEALRRQVVDPTIIAATLMPAVVGMAHIFVPAFVLSFIPDFQECIVPTQVLAIGSVFLALPVAANGLLIGQNRELIVVCTKLIGTLIVVEGTLLTIRYCGYEQMRWIATSAAAGYMVASFLSVLIVWHDYYKARPRMWLEILGLHLPLGWAILCLYLSRLTATLLGVTSMGEWIEAIFKALVFVLGYWPVVYYADRRTGIITRLLELVKRRRAAGRAGEE
jgi:O-antigen/teichoic acid export membrane protein